MYEIKVLSSDEFDQVAKSDPRYEYVDDSNMGFADRQKGIAYVRGTHIHDLNKYLISHELEELELDESTHEDPNGIRHKKFFKQFFLPLLTAGASLIPGIGPILSTVLGAVTQPRPQTSVAAPQQQSFSQPSFQQQAQAQPQSVSPQTPTSITPSGGGPLGQFSIPGAASGNIPSAIGGNVAPILGNQAFQNPLQKVGGLLNPDDEQSKGFYSGRLTF